MRGMNNLHISYNEKTISVSHERYNHPPVRKHYLYLIGGMNNLHISCEEKTTLIFQKVDRQLLYHVSKRQPLYLVLGKDKLYIS